MAATDLLCTATAGALCVGIAAADVRELVRDRLVTPVPLAGAAVRGLLNLRGDLVTVVDVRARLGQPAHPDPERGVHVVLRGEPARSLLVDAVGDIIAPDVHARRPVPTSVDPAVRPLVREAVALADDIVLLLDTDRVANLSDGYPHDPHSAKDEQ